MSAPPSRCAIATADIVANDLDIRSVVVHSHPPKVREFLDAHSPAKYTYVQTLGKSKLPHPSLHAARLGISEKHLIQLVRRLRGSLPEFELCATVIHEDAGCVLVLAFERCIIFQNPSPVQVDIRGNPRADPNRKCTSWSKKRRPIETARREGCTESLLVDQQGRIYEGCITNVFFLRDDGAIVTAPEESVLAGTLRHEVLDVCERKEMKVVHEYVLLGDLERYTAAFITNAARFLVPIERIWWNDRQISFRGDMNGMLDKLRKDVYDKMLAAALPIDD